MGTQGQWGIGHMGNETHRGKEVQGVWGTSPIRPKGYGVQGVWGTWAIGHNGYRGYGFRGYEIQGLWATWVMGHMGNGAHGQWGPWAIGTFLPITSLLLDGFLQKFY